MKPNCSGAPTTKTMGMVLIAASAASVAAVLIGVAMTSTRARTKDAATHPTANKRICHGPSLKDAYKMLGQWAAAVLAGGGGFNLDKQPIGNPDET
jgi:hypothetical protein